MRDEAKAKEQVLAELHQLRERVTALEKDREELEQAVAVLRESEDRLRIFVENKRVEQLKEEVMRRRTLMDQSRDGIVVLDQAGKVFEANRAFARMLGYPMEEMGNLSVFDWEAEMPHSELEKALRLVDASGDHFITRHRRKDGSLYDVEITTTAAVWGGQKLILCVCRDISERLKAEEALRESQKRLQRAEKVAHFGHWEFLLSTNEVKASDGAQALYGLGKIDWSLPDVQGIPLPEYRPMLDKALKELIEEGKRYSVEFKIRRPTDGKILDIHSIAEYSPENGVVFGVIQDISDRKRAEEALCESEELFRTIFEGSRDAIFITSRNARFLYVNPAACTLTGYSKQELLTMHIPDLHSPEDLRSFHEFFDRILAGEAMISEANILRKDGVKVPTEFSNSRVVLGGNLCMHTVARDITEPKLAERRLQDKNRFLQILIDAIPVSVFYKGIDGKYAGCNETYARFLGLSQEMIIGKGVYEIFPKELADTYHQMDTLLFHKPGVQEYEAKMTHADGTIHDVLFTKATYGDENGRVIGLIGAMLDITERKRAEEEKRKLEAQLRQAQKLEAIGTLAGGIAHDFNNILGAILGYTEMAMDDIPRDISAHDDLEQVLMATHRAKDLVKQILAVSRQGETQGRQPIEITPIIQEALKLLRASLPATIAVRQQLCAHSTVMGDPGQLHQIVVNLCTNAAHAMREKGGVLEVTLGEVELDAVSPQTHGKLQPGSYVRLTVADTGHGMDAPTLERIFDPYFTTKGIGEGSGLGLAVVHGIVKRHEGAISVRSELGKGTVFEMLLPRIERNQQQKEQDPQPTAKGKERILLVDDEESLARLGERILVQLGYRVTAKTNSLEAIELFTSQPESFDLVLTDYTMPHMTGIQMAREMLRIRPDMPIVLCTGFSEMISEDKAKELGIRSFIMKPIDRRTTARIIRNVLDRQMAL